MLAAASASADSTRLHFGEFISVPHVDGWKSIESTGTFPVHLVNEPHTAELLIFESILEKDEIVNDTADFRLTVEQLIETVISDLPDIELRSNTGYLHDSLARFALEFTSNAPELEGRLHHRFEGLLFRRSDGSQVLYSLWGKAAGESAPVDLPEIKQMQGGFVYAGPIAKPLFADSRTKLWYYFLPLFAIFLLLIVIRRRQATLTKVRFAENDRVWRCSCGRLNHEHQSACRRCGAQRPTVGTP